MSNLSGEAAKNRLMEGNRRFITSEVNNGDISPSLRQKLVDDGQHPYAVVVCCSDSRVVPEDIFMTGLGEIFTIRVAGNILSRSQIAAVEYAVDHLHCHLVVVLGHTKCGAIDSTIGGHVDGYTRFITDEIKRMIGDETDPYKASCINARAGAKLVRLYLKPEERPADKELMILPAMYHTDSGEVEILQ